MGFGNVMIPHSQILFVSEFSFLVSSVQHSVCTNFQIFPEILYCMKVPVHSVVITVTSDDRFQYFHRFRKRFCQPCFQPRFCCLLLRFQLLLKLSILLDTINTKKRAVHRFRAGGKIIDSEPEAKAATAAGGLPLAGSERNATLIDRR